MIEPSRECPRYLHCSINNCPLSIYYPNLIVCDDELSICTIEKQVRLRINNLPKYIGKLKYDGLTVREFSARKRYEDMSYENRRKFLEAGIKSLNEINKKRG